MSFSKKEKVLCLSILLFGIAGPLIFPNYTFQIAVLWMLVIFAQTWDTLGGQMGYNSLGNIFFFGAGMYICAVTQISLYYDICNYTSHAGAVKVDFTPYQYFSGFALGLVAAAVLSILFAVIFGWAMFGLRGPYFAIGTLGVALAAGELIGAWDCIGGGGGISLPPYPGEPDVRSYFFAIIMFAVAVVTFSFLKWLYATRFGLAINAIRDDESKAEAMGIQTKLHKTLAWTTSAVPLAIAGGIFGNMIGFIEPLEVAFPTVTFGIFMVVMVLLGGKGTLWGPILGAVLFHLVKEVTWTYLLGLQWVALGAFIVILVVFFQQGLMGWMQDKWPEVFGITVDERMSAEDKEPAS
jgi:branched-chain amino acid transport system permease protein